MTLYQLKIFEAVARHLNVTRASLELHASQPAVSRQLKFLKDYCGETFLVRHGHGLKLTDKGHAFLKAIRPILAQFEDIDRRFKKNQNSKMPQCLAIGGSWVISVAILTKLVTSFKQQYPSAEFTMAANDSSVIEKALLKREMDLAVICHPSQIEGLTYEPFLRMECVAFCLPTNPVAGETLTLKELAEYPLVIKNPSRFESVLTSQGYKMNFAVRCETSQAVKTAVRAGLGIGILFQDAVAIQLAKGSLKLVNVPDLRKMGIKSVIAYDGRKPLSSIAQEFLTLLRQRAKRVKPRS